MIDYNHIINSLYGVLCDKEKNNNRWIATTESLQLELTGYLNLPKCEDVGLIMKILAKISLLHMVNQEYFRKIILDCTNLCSRRIENR